LLFSSRFSYLLMSTTLKTCLPVLLYRTNEQRKSMISTPPQTELTSNSSASAVSKSTSTTSASSYQTSREQFAATRKGSARSNRLSNLPRSSATASSSFQQQQPGAAAAFDAVLVVDDSVEEWAKLQEEADKLYAKVAAEADDTFMGLRPPSRSPYRQGAVMCRGADFYDTFNNYIYDGGLGRYKNR
jgi:hypothetical protein